MNISCAPTLDMITGETGCLTYVVDEPSLQFPVCNLDNNCEEVNPPPTPTPTPTPETVTELPYTPSLADTGLPIDGFIWVAVALAVAGIVLRKFA
jgi:hypothetical protein